VTRGPFSFPPLFNSRARRHHQGGDTFGDEGMPLPARQVARPVQVRRRAVHQQARWCEGVHAAPALRLPSSAVVDDSNVSGVLPGVRGGTGLLEGFDHARRGDGAGRRGGYPLVV
jgi:hypothetical protein